MIFELTHRGGAESGFYRGVSSPRVWMTVRRTMWMLKAALFDGAVLADSIVSNGNAAPGQRPKVIAIWKWLPQANTTAPN